MPSTNVQKTSTTVVDDDGSEREQVQYRITVPRKLAEEFELTSAIRSRRSNCIPHETARQLLAYDLPGHMAIVGIDREWKKAVLYHEGDRYAIAVRFGPEGLADGGLEIARFGSGIGLETWIGKMRYFWGWIHPRYR